MTKRKLTRNTGARASTPATRGRTARAADVTAEPARTLSAEPGPARGPTKQPLIIGLLQRQEGATLADLVAATGWLPHTTRAALTRLRQAGHLQAAAPGDLDPASARLLDRLTSEGRSIMRAELIGATGWLPRTTRAALTGLSRKGHSIERSAGADGASVYRVVSRGPDPPTLVQAAVEGRLPRGAGLQTFTDPPLAWSRQHRLLDR